MLMLYFFNYTYFLTSITVYVILSEFPPENHQTNEWRCKTLVLAINECAQ